MTRYTADPTEISLVDVPCLPGATFEIVKDGVVEQRAFACTCRSRQSPASEPAAPPPPPRGAAGPPLPGAGQGRARYRERGRHIGEGGRRELAPARGDRRLAPQLDALDKRVATLEAQPQPARAALRAPPREWDAGAAPPVGGVEAAIKTLSELPEQERTMALMKVSLANPTAPRF